MTFPLGAEYQRIGEELHELLRARFGGLRPASDAVALSACLLSEAIELQIRILRSGGLVESEAKALELFLELAQRLWTNAIEVPVPPEWPEPSKRPERSS